MSIEHRKTETESRPESKLIRAAQRGSEEAVEGLVRNHWHDAYSTALGIVGDAASAEDVAQDAMLSAIRGLDRFDRRRTFSPWLARIVTNRALDSLRARARRPEVSLDGRVIAEIPAPPPPRGFSDELIAALQRLDRRERAIVVLRHVAGFSSKEIAEIVDMSPTAVRSALQRALDRLRSQLDDGPLEVEAERPEEAR